MKTAFFTSSHRSLKGNTATILVPSTASYTSFNNNATVNEQNCCSFVVHGLSPFTHYEIKVSALNIAGEGPLSSPFSAKTSEEGEKFHFTSNYLSPHKFTVLINLLTLTGKVRSVLGMKMNDNEF